MSARASGLTRLARTRTRSEIAMIAALIAAMTAGAIAHGGGGGDSEIFLIGALAGVAVAIGVSAWHDSKFELAA